MREMVKRGQIQVLDGEIIRFKRAEAKQSGLTPSTIADASRKVKRLGTSVYQGLKEGENAELYEESPSFTLTAEQMALIRPCLERRIKVFLQALETEFGGKQVKDSEQARKGYGVGVFSWKE